ncbi:MAG: DUF1697 domain-containing protein [Ignavibacteria bacterium]|nr:DUF1697 domain-containing protein [Ignavibacteria bacterium]
MKKFITLLRGINVSGQKKIKMSELQFLFKEMGFREVETYIQSGNVMFSSKEKTIEKIEAKISSGIRNKFGFDVQVIVITPEEIEYILKNNPFVKKKKDTKKLYLTILAKTPLDANIKKMHAVDYSPEEYFIDGKNVYLFVPNGYGKAKLNNNIFENKLKVFGTTRNWKTIRKLSELAKSH